jgi:hypothetical protein
MTCAARAEVHEASEWARELRFRTSEIESWLTQMEEADGP